MAHFPTIVSSASSHLQRLFDVEHLPSSDLEALHFKLSGLVLHLLQQDLSRLLYILYRVDVEERQVKEAMVADDAEIIADRISRLIIKREMQKAQTRIKYSQN